jgi:hypothetical protein
MTAIGGNLGNTVKETVFGLNANRSIIKTYPPITNGVFVILRYKDTTARQRMAQFAKEELKFWGGVEATNPNLSENIARRLYEYYIAGGFKVPANATPP